MTPDTTPHADIQHAINVQREQLAEELRTLERAEQSASTSLQREWATQMRAILQGHAHPNDEKTQTLIQRLVAELAVANAMTQEALHQAAPGIEEDQVMEREEQILEHMLAENAPNASFAWYRESEREHWEAFHRHVIQHQSAIQAHNDPQLTRAMELLELRIKSFTDDSAREQLRGVTEQEGKAALHALLAAAEHHGQERIAA